MNIPTVNSCCCGCDLPKGCRILGGVFLVFSILGLGQGLTSGDPITIFFSFYNLIESILLAIGAFREMPACILGYLVMSVLHLVLTALAILYMVLCMFSPSLHPQYEEIKNQASQLGMVPHDIDEQISTAAGVTAVFLFVLLGVSAYFFVVVYSFYKQLKGGSRGIQNEA